MQPIHIILAAILAASAALQTAVAENKLPAPKPEFKTQEQLVKWSEEKTKEAAAADSASAIRDSQFFYTGKPYLEETGTYAFRFRSYDPELSRWTSADPSGFPDGANNIRYDATPTSEFDYQGLRTINVFNAHYKTTFTFDFHTDHFQSWQVIRGYAMSGAMAGAPVGLVGGASSWQWLPPETIGANMAFTNSISSIVNTTNNSAVGLKFAGTENVFDIIWNAPVVDSQTSRQVVATAEWKVSYTFIYE